MYLNFAPAWSRQLVSVLTIAALLILSVSVVFAPPRSAQAAVTGTLIPTADGTYTGWIGDYDDINDAVGSEDCGSSDGNENVATSTLNARESFSLTLSSIPNGSTITSVDVIAYAKKASSGNADFKTFTRFNGTNLDASSSITATGSCSSNTQTLNVVDTVKSGATTLEIGVLKTDTDNIFMGVLRAVVTYTAPVNNPPVLGVIGAQSGNELTNITFDANATDADVGNVLTFSLAPHVTTATIDSGTGVFSWTPAEADGAGVYNFNVIVSDGTDTDSEIVAVTVNEVNVAPIANDYSEATHMNDDFTTTLQGSDTDVPANTLTYTVTVLPTNGTVGAVVGNLVTYTPNADYVGSDSFTYQVSDGTLTDTGVVSVTVNNSAPVIDAIADPSVAEGTLLSFTATATDTDVPADTLTFSMDPNGTGASMTSGGVFSWTPTEADGPGVYSFTVEVTDGAATDSEFVVVTVTEVNTPPVAVNDATSTVINTPISIPLATLLVNDTDVDVPANTLSVIIIGPATFGTAIINGSNIDFTPATNFVGSDSFSYFVFDGTATDEGLVTVSVSSAACSDESDNDEDGLSDFPADPGCSSLSDTNETDAPAPAPDADTTPLGGGMPSLLGGGTNPGINAGSVLGAFTENTDHGKVLGAAIAAAELQGEVLGASTSSLATSCTAEKRLITSNLGLGRNNPVDQVKLLQNFLNLTLGLSIPNSGVFGPMTFDGVKTFQAAHATEILAPWGITQPTGYVGITTRRMIDIMVCGADYPLPTL